MSDLMFTFNAVIPLFGVMGLGYFLEQRRFFGKNFLSVLNRFCFVVTLPCTLFRSTYSAVLSEIFSLRLIVVALLGVLGAIALLCLVLPLFVKDRARASAMIQGAYRSNAALFGLPLALNLFGESGIGPATILLTIIIPTFNISAVILLQCFSGDSSKKIPWKNVLWEISHNGLIIGSLLGILLSSLGVHLPVVVEKTVSDLAATATPLAMLALGGQFDLGKALSNLRYNLTTCLIKLIVLPLAMMVLSIRLGFRGPELGALYVLFAAPSSTSSFIMATNMGSDGELAGQIVVSTTFFSIFTIFLGVYLLKSLGFI